TELRKYRDQARELALRSAREKADLLTESLGTSTGCVLKINENSWSSYSGSWSGRSSFASYQNFVQEAPPPAAEPRQSEGGDGPISLGQLAVCAEVSVEFALR
ncbi:MAG TPA: SIMPL domain-containing protein, partial [Herpetosiphonaceae bacterium]|nr:SIMPL domain-containing protein [Herpetosiphonaceae bacterium]